jgi:hypothetical protein
VFFVRFVVKDDDLFGQRLSTTPQNKVTDNQVVMPAEAGIQKETGCRFSPA